MVTKKNRPKEFRVDEGTEIAGEVTKFCSHERIEIYSTLSGTKAEFVKRTKRSLENILYRYMEFYGYKNIHNISHFLVKMSSRSNRSLDMKPNHVKNSDFMSIVYSKPLREYKKPKFGIGYRIRNSTFDLPFGKR